MDAIRLVEAGQLKKDRDGFGPGDTVRVHARIVEGEKERTQVFEGIVIRRRGDDPLPVPTIATAAATRRSATGCPGRAAARKRERSDHATTRLRSGTKSTWPEYESIRHARARSTSVGA